jgi:hypothetical protein
MTSTNRWYRQLSTPAIIISYSLQSSSVPTKTLSAALNTAVSSGSFNTNLNQIAGQTGATGLTTATSSAPLITNNSPTFQPTMKPTPSTFDTIFDIAKNNSGLISGVVVGVVVFLLCAALWYNRYYAVKKSKQVTVEISTNNPLGHRVAINSDGSSNSNDDRIPSSLPDSESAVNQMVIAHSISINDTSNIHHSSGSSNNNNDDRIPSSVPSSMSDSEAMTTVHTDISSTSNTLNQHYNV